MLSIDYCMFQELTKQQREREADIVSACLETQGLEGIGISAGLSRSQGYAKFALGK